MQKLKIKKQDNLLNYKLFLKNNYLKKNKYNLKNILFENDILFKNQDLNLNIIELNNYKNIFLSTNLFNSNKILNSKLIYTIKSQYKNQLLFNYNLNYNIVSYFNKLIFKNFIKKNQRIKGRVIGGNNKKIYIYIFGYIFSIMPQKLSNLCNKKKKTFKLIKLKRKKAYSFIKIIKAKQIVKCYKLRFINFNIDFFNDYKNLNKIKIILSRVSYINKIIKNNELKLKKKLYIKKKRKFLRKLHVLKMNKKKK